MESLRKDVKCVFGILKGRWVSLDKGFKYLDDDYHSDYDPEDYHPEP